MSETETTDKTKELVEKAFRKKTGINEKLLAMRLIQSTFATDTKTIISNVSMAASMVSEINSELEGLDFEKIKAIKQIYDDIHKTEYARLQLPKRGTYDFHIRYAQICPIPFSIERTEETFQKYFSPWVPSLNYRSEGIKVHRKELAEIRHANELYIYGYSGCGRGCYALLELVEVKEADKTQTKWIGQECPKCKKVIEEDVVIQEIKDHIIEKPKWSFFFEVSQCLTHTGFKTLSTSFNNWAEDECGKAIMVMGRLVSQNIYDQVLKQLRTGDVEKPRIEDNMA